MKFNVGIIGCGSITRLRHAPEYRDNPHVQDIIFYDRSIERAEKLAKEFGGRAVKTLEELLHDPSIIAISDCSSNESHHINTTRALLSGKHVLCEKPIAISVKYAEEMAEAERKSGKILMIDHNQRFTAAHQKAKELIEKQELGEVLTFKTTFGHEGPENWGITKSNATWFFKKDRSYSGVIGDLGIHKIDLIHWLLNDEIEEVHGFYGALDKVDENGKSIEVPDNAVCALKTKKGRLGTASFSWTYYGEEDNSTTIYCREGILKIYHQGSPLLLEKRDGTVLKFELENIQTNDNQTSTGIIDAFIDCIVNEKESPISSSEAIASLKVVEKLLNIS
ncbi:Gfo/Idh/MocA family protein [Ornithinibacillus scapharcae]|uniref:Gfo/Idh/MocA family protein n=1 Tax=Ornithinibacillus scapharcae TaxID=1147159 RepID=UPI000225BB78|nr:Gfo/Idh/MocA family oxidoreductase [Ornithinibacillus scapharcae]